VLWQYFVIKGGIGMTNAERDAAIPDGWICLYSWNNPFGELDVGQGRQRIIQIFKERVEELKKNGIKAMVLSSRDGMVTVVRKP